MHITRTKRHTLATTMAASIMLLAGCGSPTTQAGSNTATGTETSGSQSQSTTKKSIELKVPTTDPSSATSQSAKAVAKANGAKTCTGTSYYSTKDDKADDPGCEVTEYNAFTDPDYWDTPVNANGAGMDDATLAMAPGTIKYSKLDDLGRSGVVKAVVTLDMVNEDTASDSEDKMPNPAGWPKRNAEVTIKDTHTLEFDDVAPHDYHGWLFNRSHLLAKSLGGEDTKQNLITATHTQSVGMQDTGVAGGMAYGETLVRNWLRANPSGHVYYKVTPNYYEGDLIPFSVTVQIQSQMPDGITSNDSDGDGDGDDLSEYINVYNTAHGYLINYNNGEYVKIEE